MEISTIINGFFGSRTFALFCFAVAIILIVVMKRSVKNNLEQCSYVDEFLGFMALTFIDLGLLAIIHWILNGNFC